MSSLSSQSKTFCTRPFTSLYIGVDGKFKFCCADMYSKTNESISDQLHITKTNLLDVWNSDTYKSIRYKLLNGIEPKVCVKCFQKPNDGTAHGARRTVDWQLGADYPYYNVEMGLESVTFIELWFENKCNLKCRMCNPYSSNQIIPEWNDIIASNEFMKSNCRSLTKDDITNLTSQNWTESPAAWDNLAAFIKAIFSNNSQQIITIMMSGGEPMICDGMYRLFDFCVAKDFAKNIVLKYKTNLTVLPSKMLEYWKYFKKIDFDLSIDGTDKTYEYIRYPAKWQKLLANIEILKQFNNLGVTVHPTIQAYNILSITDLYKWCLETPFDHFDIHQTHRHLTFTKCSDPLYSPKILNIRILPKELKILAAQRLMNFYESYNHKKGIKQKQAEFFWLIKYMLSEDWFCYFDDFKKFTNHIDKNRNQNVLDTIPELSKYW